MSNVSIATKNEALAGILPAFVSWHSGFPGTTGANELTGSGYVRQAVAFAAPSGGQALLVGTAVSNVPASTVRFSGFWTAGGQFMYTAPNGGATPRNFTVDVPTDEVTSSEHGYTDGQTVVYVGGMPPAPLVEGTVYYVRDVSTNKFKNAATLGGSAIDLTAPASYNCSVCAITEQFYAVPDTHRLTAATIAIPD